MYNMCMFNIKILFQKSSFLSNPTVLGIVGIFDLLAVSRKYIVIH